MPDHVNLNNVRNAFSAGYERLYNLPESRSILWELFPKGSAKGDLFAEDSVGPRTDIATHVSNTKINAIDRKTMESLHDIASGSRGINDLLDVLVKPNKHNKSRSQVVAQDNFAEDWIRHDADIFEELDPKNGYVMQNLFSEVAERRDDMILDKLRATSVLRTDAAGDGKTYAAVNLPSTSQLSLALGEGTVNAQIFAKAFARMRNNGVPRGHDIYCLMSHDSWAQFTITEKELVGSADYQDPETKYFETGDIPPIIKIKPIPHDKIAANKFHFFTKKVMKIRDFGKHQKYCKQEGAFRDDWALRLSHKEGCVRRDDNAYLEVTVTNPA